MSRLWQRRDEAAAAAPPEPLAPKFVEDSLSGAVVGGGDLRPPAEALPAGRQYSPYAGLPGGFDPSFSKALLSLPDAPEFVFSEEALMKRRSWSENLTYVTGVAYCAGSVGGGAAGAAAVLRSPLPVGAEGSLKLRVNRLLNGGGRAGRAAGNTAGVAGLLYSSLDSALSASRGTHDGWNTLAAGVGTGALYKLPAGARAAAVWGAGGGLLAGVGVLGGALVDRMLH